jgi:hypothetical protein
VPRCDNPVLGSPRKRLGFGLSRFKTVLSPTGSDVGFGFASSPLPERLVKFRALAFNMVYFRLVGNWESDVWYHKLGRRLPNLITAAYFGYFAARNLADYIRLASAPGDDGNIANRYFFAYGLCAIFAGVNLVNTVVDFAHNSKDPSEFATMTRHFYQDIGVDSATVIRSSNPTPTGIPEGLVYLL